MSVPFEKIHEAAPDVLPKARSHEVYNNPFITLSSLYELCSDDEALTELVDNTLMYCLRYTETVCKFEQIVSKQNGTNESAEARREIEEIRTRTHDATIDAINILSREMHKKGVNNTWISKVSKMGRPGYMKFAILLAFEAVLK